MPVLPARFSPSEPTVRAPVPRASALNPQLPKDLDELFFKLMQKRPEDRPQTAEEVRDLLLPALWVATWLGRDIEWQGRAVAGAAEAGGKANVDGLETLAP